MSEQRFLPGWDLEPSPAPDGLDPGLTAYLNQLATCGEGREAGGKRRWVYLDKPIHVITAPEEYL